MHQTYLQELTGLFHFKLCINAFISTKALGHIAPPESSYRDFEDGVKIPGAPEKSPYQVMENI